MRHLFKKTALGLTALTLAFGGGVVSSDAAKDKLGNFEFVLGTSPDTALSSLRNQFDVTLDPPQIDGMPDERTHELPNRGSFTIRDKSGAELGSAVFQDGKLVQVSQYVPMYTSPENGKLVKDLIAALSDARANGGEPLRVFWFAEKPGNPEIRFRSGNRTVSLRYFEGGSDSVLLSSAVGGIKHPINKD